MRAKKGNGGKMGYGSIFLMYLFVHNLPLCERLFGPLVPSQRILRTMQHDCVSHLHGAE